jgi:hypothetical protein
MSVNYANVAFILGVYNLFIRVLSSYPTDVSESWTENADYIMVSSKYFSLECIIWYWDVCCDATHNCEVLTPYASCNKMKCTISTR